jgi:hypothetical protein
MITSALVNNIMAVTEIIDSQLKKHVALEKFFSKCVKVYS